MLTKHQEEGGKEAEKLTQQILSVETFLLKTGLVKWGIWGHVGCSVS